MNVTFKSFNLEHLLLKELKVYLVINKKFSTGNIKNSILLSRITQ